MYELAKVKRCFRLLCCLDKERFTPARRVTGLAVEAERVVVFRSLIGVGFWSFVNLTTVLQFELIAALGSLSVYKVDQGLQRILFYLLVGDQTGSVGGPAL